MLEQVLIAVWRQSLIDKKKTVDIGSETYHVRQTSKSKLKQIDFRRSEESPLFTSH